MKLGLDSKQLLLKLKQGFAPILRHHVIIAFVFVVGVLIAAVFIVNDILTQTTDQAYLAEQQSEGVKTRFDEATIKRVDALISPERQTSLTLNTGDQRVNPFVE